MEYGAQKRRQPPSERADLDLVLSPFDELSFDAGECARHYGAVRWTLEREGIAIGAMDLLIAAHACALPATLVTNNQKHFARVPNLHYCQLGRIAIRARPRTRWRRPSAAHDVDPVPLPRQVGWAPRGGAPRPGQPYPISAATAPTARAQNQPGATPIATVSTAATPAAASDAGPTRIGSSFSGSTR